jgi:hypothetical protein
VQALLILLLALVVLGRQVPPDQPHGLINPTDSPEEAQALGILIGEVASKPAVLRFPDAQQVQGAIWPDWRRKVETGRGLLQRNQPACGSLFGRHSIVSPFGFGA